MTLIHTAPTRRRLLQAAAASGLGLIAAPALLRYAGAQSWRAGDPFSLGVASGAPRPDGFVLWTRLAPEPLSGNPQTPGGMRGGDVAVGYEIATDPALRDIVRRGEATAERAFAYSVHLDVGGLQPGRPYWYRFMSGDAASRIGRAGTLPAPDSVPDRLRFGFVSCSDYEHGYFSAYRHLADENPEFVLYLGDYIYETIEERRPTVRRHSDGIEAATLPTYRNRYAQYRLDPDLARLHAEVPALVTWDDHEVANDYADKWSERFDDPELFLMRRAAAYQAFYEHMPMRPILSQPNGPIMRVYDRFTFGDLIEISLIDGRQYRSRPACYAPPNKGGTHLETDASCPDRREAGRTMMGFAQEAWLYSGLAHAKAQWNLIAQDVLMAQYHVKQNDAFAFSTDDWDGYPANRTRFSSASTTRKCPIRSSSAATSIRSSPTTCGSISTIKARRSWRRNSSAPRSRHTDRPTILSRKRCRTIRTCISSRAGAAAMSCVDLERAHMQVQMRVVSDVRDPKADVATLRTFAVEGGKPGVVAA